MADIDAREVRSFLVKSNRSELSTIYSDSLEPMSVVAVDETRQPYGMWILYVTHYGIDTTCSGSPVNIIITGDF